MDFVTLALASHTKYVFHNPRNEGKKAAAELRSQLMMLSASVAVGVSVIGVCLRWYREYQINSLLQISKQAFCRQVGNRQEV